MAQFSIKCRCSACHHTWRYKAFSATSDASDVVDPPCPKCATAQRDIGMDVSAGRAPAVGGSIAVKAMDTAARITMEDHGLTDLSSTGRPGENMAPKLSPAQQELSDSMFAPKPMNTGMAALAARANAMAKAAMGGQGLGAFGYSEADKRIPNPIQVVQAPRQKPAVHLLNPRAKDGSYIT